MFLPIVDAPVSRCEEHVDRDHRHAGGWGRELGQVEGPAGIGLDPPPEEHLGGLPVLAVRSLQTTSGVVPASGVLGLDTWTRLDAAFAALPPPVPSARTPAT
jgi:hypothetical protein